MSESYSLLDDLEILGLSILHLDLIERSWYSFYFYFYFTSFMIFFNLSSNSDLYFIKYI